MKLIEHIKQFAFNKTTIANMCLILAITVGKIVLTHEKTAVAIKQPIHSHHTKPMETIAPKGIDINSVVLISAQLSDKAIADERDIETKISSVAAISGVSLSTAVYEGSYKCTGFFISDTGYILTVAHLLLNLAPQRMADDSFDAIDDYVKKNAEVTVNIKNMPGQDFKAKIIDVNPTYDLTVLKIEGVKPKQYFGFAKDDEVYRGEPVTAIGHPLDFQWLWKPNTISAKEIYDFLVPPSMMELVMPEYIYVLSGPEDAGMSGAPLLDKNGKVVGVIEQYESDQNSSPIDVATPGFIAKAYLEAVGIALGG